LREGRPVQTSLDQGFDRAPDVGDGAVRRAVLDEDDGGVDAPLGPRDLRDPEVRGRRGRREAGQRLQRVARVLAGSLLRDRGAEDLEPPALVGEHDVHEAGGMGRGRWDLGHGDLLGVELPETRRAAQDERPDLLLAAACAQVARTFRPFPARTAAVACFHEVAGTSTHAATFTVLYSFAYRAPAMRPSAVTRSMASLPVAGFRTTATRITRPGALPFCFEGIFFADTVNL